MFKSRYLIIFILATLFGGQAAFCQEGSDVEKHVLSAFIYQFSKLVKWPKKSGDFIINVIEDDDLLKVLEETMADKKVGDRPVKVLPSNWSDVVLTTPDIVVFPSKISSFHKPVIGKLKNKPCMVVAFSDGLGEAGATINFFLKDGKLKFELNTKSVKEKGLEIDPVILKLAKIID